MRYAKKRDTEIDWQVGDEGAPERLVRVRRREMPMSPRVTRKMAKIDAQLLAKATREDVPRSRVPTAPPPPLREAVQPPPLALPFPFPFANTASTTFTLNDVAAEVVELPDGFVPIALSSMIPREISLAPCRGAASLVPREISLAPCRGAASLVPREPDPFTLLPPRSVAPF